MELLPLIALFAIAGVTTIADLVAQYPWWAAIAGGGAYLALVRAEFGQVHRMRRMLAVRLRWCPTRP